MHVVLVWQWDVCTANVMCAAAQLMLALDYCHKIGVSSRDVKLENTLLEKAPGRRPMLKLCGAPQLLSDPAQLR